MALTYNWNTISAGQCDADSPIDEVLMEAIRQDLIHLKEWLGKDYTAAENHDHDGVNSKTIVASIGRNELKTSTGEVSLSRSPAGASEQFSTLPGGEYGFETQWKVNFGYDITEMKVLKHGARTSGFPQSYISEVYMRLETTTNDVRILYVKQRYITASGTEFWLFLLYDKKVKQIRSAWAAPDHPCFGSHATPDECPHGFLEYFNKPLPINHEIILLDMESTNRIIQKSKENNQTVLEYLHESGEIEIDMTKKVKWQPRDMDGKQRLEKKHNSYTLRKMIWRKKWSSKRKTKSKL